MILIITKENISFIDYLELKNINKIKCPGELKISKGISKIMKDEVIIYKSTDSIVQCRVGIRWVIENLTEIKTIMFFGFVDPTNSLLLKNHFLIPTKIINIDEPALEWNRKNLFVKTIITNPNQQKIIRNAIYNSNLDYIYGNIASIFSSNYSKNIVLDISSLEICLGINNLCFSVNELAKEYNVNIINILIGAPKKYYSSKKIKYKKFFSNLNIGQ